MALKRSRMRHPRGNRKKTPLAIQVCLAIRRHLERFADDKALNPEIGRFPDGSPERLFFRPHVYLHRNSEERVVLKYRCYAGGVSIRYDEAQLYLDWLDAGGVGTVEQMRDRAPRPLRPPLTLLRLEEV